MKPSLQGDVSIPGDKSITHRALLFAALTKGRTTIDTYSLGRDNLACVRVLGQLGVSISGQLSSSMLEIAKEEGLEQFIDSGNQHCRIEVEGVGFNGLKSPSSDLDCGNSGTLGRLLTGYLAGTKVEATLVGDESLSMRPFGRVVKPLSKMGAKFSADLLPITISSAALSAISHFNEKASAQVKSAVLLAGLKAKGQTVVVEPHRSRDHTERMLEAMGCELKEGYNAENFWEVSIKPCAELKSQQSVEIPGDFSAASFFLVAGSIFENSELRIRRVGINPTRIGLMHLLKRMGASIEVENASKVAGELIADIVVRYNPLNAIELGRQELVLAIDEIPILCIAAVAARGTTKITGGEELRVKETDRISQMVSLLGSFGVEVEEFEDGLSVTGSSPDKLSVPGPDASWRTSGDHRIAMSGAILELWLSGDLNLCDEAAVETSFPNFSNTLAACIRDAEG